MPVALENVVGTHAIKKLVDAANDGSSSANGTHWFYNYPAKLSPILTNRLIRTLSEPGDLVVDPFVGGGTTAVESKALGRDFVGCDISELAVFVSRMKTGNPSQRSLNIVKSFRRNLDQHAQLRPRAAIPTKQIDRLLGVKNMSRICDWRIVNVLAGISWAADRMRDEQASDIVRCGLLATGQWIVEVRAGKATVRDVRQRLCDTLRRMVETVEQTSEMDSGPSVSIHNRPASQIIEAIREQYGRIRRPNLVLTSPPYPNVHVLYHRWQLRGRRETDLPFALANVNDGHGESYYTLGGRDRKNPNTIKDIYFRLLRESLGPIVAVLGPNSLVVQVVAFRQPEIHLQEYLETMSDIGLDEVPICSGRSGDSCRIWRPVPSRRWYTRIGNPSSTGREVVLVHRVSSP